MSFTEYIKNKRVILVGPAPYLKERKKTAFVDSFDVVVKMNEIAKQLSEDGLKTSGTQSKGREERIKELQSHPAFMDRMNPEHKSVIDEWQSLLKVG